MKRLLALTLLACMLATLCTGCKQSQTTYQKDQALEKAGTVHLNITGMTPSSKAMEGVIASFCTVYPNCSIDYEYVQNYEESMQTRLANNDNVDLFLTKNITANSPYLPYALNCAAEKERLDLSDTYDGLIQNFTLSGENGNALYAIPLGGEVRGLYVNRTLLSSLNLSVPTKESEFVTCCQTLKEAGYIPMQGNPGSFGQLLMYPYVCNLIANAADPQGVYTQVNTCAPGVSEQFRAPMRELYDMVKNGYYNYKYVETTCGAFLDDKDETIVKDFLNIVSTDGTEKKKDDLGQVAFMPGTMSLKALMDKTKEDYHSAIDYVFMLAPVGTDGGYAYLSPSTGIAVNKNSPNTAWALEFLNYLFSKSVNQDFASAQSIIPNTKSALDTIQNTFQVQSDHICQLGQVTFDYVFFDVMKKSLTEVSKGNNPKYMQEDGTMYDLEHYMTALENAFAAQRTGM